MTPADLLLHLLNLMFPAAALGLLAPALAKLFWRLELHEVPYVRLVLWTGGAVLLTTLAGLMWTGNDGRMVTYGASVVAAALALWWAGWYRS